MKLPAYTLRRKGGDRMYIYYLAAPLLGFSYNGSTTLQLPEKLQAPAILDLATGKLYEIPADHILHRDGKQYLLRVVLRDYPMAVIDLSSSTLPLTNA